MGSIRGVRRGCYDLRWFVFFECVRCGENIEWDNVYVFGCVYVFYCVVL